MLQEITGSLDSQQCRLYWPLPEHPSFPQENPLIVGCWPLAARLCRGTRAASKADTLPRSMGTGLYTGRALVNWDSAASAHQVQAFKMMHDPAG